MKKLMSRFLRPLAAPTGKLILSLYNLYTSLFVKKDGLELLHPPLQQREIILVKKTGRGYKAMADVLVMN